MLPLLPLTGKAYGLGDISWSQVKQITRLRKKRPSIKEEEWVAFACGNTVAALKGEVRNALKEGRDGPRTGTWGLPNICMKLTLRFLREGYEIARKALEAKALAMRAASGDPDWRPTPEEVFLAFLEEGGSYEVLYRICPECRKGHIHTEDGLVEVPPESLARVEKVARKVEIGFDEELVKAEALTKEEARDIPEALRRKVLALYGHACARCGRKLGLHIHHCLAWSDGGPHAVWNMAPLCRMDHACVHGHTLEVYRDCLGDLHWR